jgi:hypothetical protein
MDSHSRASFKKCIEQSPLKRILVRITDDEDFWDLVDKNEVTKLGELPQDPLLSIGLKTMIWKHRDHMNMTALH